MKVDLNFIEDEERVSIRVPMQCLPKKGEWITVEGEGELFVFEVIDCGDHKIKKKKNKKYKHVINVHCELHRYFKLDETNK